MVSKSDDDLRYGDYSIFVDTVIIHGFAGREKMFLASFISLK